MKKNIQSFIGYLNPFTSAMIVAIFSMLISVMPWAPLKFTLSLFLAPLMSLVMLRWGIGAGYLSGLLIALAEMIFSHVSALDVMGLTFFMTLLPLTITIVIWRLYRTHPLNGIMPTFLGYGLFLIGLAAVVPTEELSFGGADVAMILESLRQDANITTMHYFPGLFCMIIALTNFFNLWLGKITLRWLEQPHDCDYDHTLCVNPKGWDIVLFVGIVIALLGKYQDSHVVQIMGKLCACLSLPCLFNAGFTVVRERLSQKIHTNFFLWTKVIGVLSVLLVLPAAGIVLIGMARPFLNRYPTLKEHKNQ